MSPGRTDTGFDQILAEQFRQGNEQAFNCIFAEHRTEIFAFLQRRVGSFAEADDLTEEVFIKAWENHASFDPLRGSLRAWLYIIAKSVRSSFFRKLKRRVEGFLSAPGNDQDLQTLLAQRPSKEPSIEGSLISQEQVIQCLRKLSEPLREVIELTVCQELSTQEAAEVLEIPVGTVSSRKSNALRRLREILEASHSYGVITND